TTFANVAPAAASTSPRFFITWRVSASIPPRTSPPESGSSPIWPLQNTSSPTRIACEYGPIAAGAFGLTIGVLRIRFLRASAKSLASLDRATERYLIGELQIAPVRNTAGDP